MANEKTKAQALKELGEKITGKTLTSDNTVVGMIDQITNNYSGGGSGGESDIVLKTAIDASKATNPITDTEDIALLNNWVTRINNKSTDVPRTLFMVSDNEAGTIQVDIFNICTIMVNGNFGYFSGGALTGQIGSGALESVTRSFIITNEGNDWVMLFSQS